MSLVTHSMELSNSPESLAAENHINFRAPPPSPIYSSRRSSFTNDAVLTNFLEQSLRVPDLILPDKIFPKQRSVQAPSVIDFESLVSTPTPTPTPKALPSVPTIPMSDIGKKGIGIRERERERERERSGLREREGGLS